MTVQVTGYGGINEIGGSKILLEDGDRRISFDFGLSFGRYGQYFDGVFTHERTVRGLLDLIALGLLPPLRGLLRPDLVPALTTGCLDITTVAPTGKQKAARSRVAISARGEDAFWDTWQRRYPGAFRDLRRDSGPAIDAVLFSHAHQDHIADALYLACDIPALRTRMTAFISKVLADVGMEGQGAAYANPYVLDCNGSLGVERGTAYIGRPWSFIDGDAAGPAAGDPLQSANAFWQTAMAAKGMTRQPCAMPACLNVRHWPVDHSIFGAAGFAVETSAGWVGYTGDLRAHGRFAAQTRAFAEALHDLHPVALLCEGTRLSPSATSSEAEAHGNCLAAAQAAAGQMVIADFAPRNVERMQAFVDIAAQTRRCLLVQPKDAYLLRAMHLADPLLISDWMAGPHVGLYADPRGSMKTWEAMIRERYADRTVDHITVSRNPGDYILAFSLTDLADMLDIHTLMGGRCEGVYIFSNSAAYDDEQKVDMVRLWDWTEYLGLRLVGLKKPTRNEGGALVAEQVPGYHSSGHAGQADLVDFVRTVQPKTLIPIHTEAAHLWRELLAGSGIEIVEPAMGQPICIQG